MNDASALESTTPTERLVLYELARLAEQGLTPARAPMVVRRCRKRLERLDEVVGSRCSEADIIRSCRSLHDHGLVQRVASSSRSAVGMGRPAYELDVDPASVQEFVGANERFRDLERTPLML